ncbi:unnamed protein product [Paramecium sonneborni]|uniref:Uncharacterized protein n=1 Tax=Paramecium sonneborni TaxID=65129 RepID=A0A8S1QGX6_9CILI|nr:unnamed protein product [Paramecium sonneborni]
MSLHSSYSYDSLRAVIFEKAIKECAKIQNYYHLSESSSDIKSNIFADSEKYIQDKEYIIEFVESQIILNNQQSSLSQFDTQQ